jgi:hypothetical protein
MVRFINHNDRELIGIEPGEASGAAPAEGWNRGYNDIAAFRCALSGLLDLHFEIGIGGKQFVTSLMEQLCAMRKDQHASLHAEERRELRKDDGLAGAGGETDELTSCARFISIENRGKALALIIAQADWRLHDAEYTSFAVADRHPHPGLQERDPFVVTVEAQAESLGIPPERAKDRFIMRLTLT